MGDDVSQSSKYNTLHTKDVKRSKFDRLLEVGRRLLPKPCHKTAIPSASSSHPSRMSESQLTDDSQYLIRDDLLHRKTSAPTSVGVGLPELSVNTFGGEAAGSGYGWINAPGVGEPYHSVESVMRAQQMGLRMVNERIKWTKQQIDSCNSDEQMIAKFVAVTFPEELNALHERSNYLTLRDTVKSLEKEVDELRKLLPKSSPLSRSKEPHQRLTWSCVRCHEENPVTEYRCQCSLPRPAIDPREAIRCNCVYCSEVTAERVFVSPTPGDGDWLLVNRLSVDNGVAAHQ